MLVDELDAGVASAGSQASGDGAEGKEGGSEPVRCSLLPGVKLISSRGSIASGFAAT